MTLQEFYASIGGDYEGVLGRMMRKESMVQKFVLKFLKDDSFNTLLHALEAADYDEAFRAAHTIKGVGQNLGFTALFESAGELSEALRGGKAPEDPALFQRVSDDYRRTVEAIQAFQASLNA